MEYSRFGDKIIQRESADYEWEDVPGDQLDVAEQALATEAAVTAAVRAAKPPRVRIIRSEQNKQVADKLGLNADELAERLARPDANAGSRTRVDDAEFDALMAELGLSPEEARARFKGTYWD